jgi:hypothetical protein
MSVALAISVPIGYQAFLFCLAISEPLGLLLVFNTLPSTGDAHMILLLLFMESVLTDRDRLTSLYFGLLQFIYLIYHATPAKR